MTQEEKLQEAKRLYKTANSDQRYVLESLFPELKESEYERIRKALVRFHKSSIDIDGIKGEDIIAWLEKQGEQKTVNDTDEEIVEAPSKAWNGMTKKQRKENSMTKKEIQDRMEACPWRERPIGNPYVCTRYWGTTVLCDGACSWVVDYPKLKELKAQKGE